MEFENVVKKFYFYFPLLEKELLLLHKKASFFSYWYDKRLPASFRPIVDEICLKIGDFKVMSSYQNGKIAWHVLKMLISLTQSSHFISLNDSDKEILLWASLLHDIAKRGKPICNHKDPIHPFKSACQTLLIFRGLNFITVSESLIEEWNDVFAKAYKKLPGRDESLVQDNSFLPQIFELLNKALGEKTSLERDVVILVLLHQSLPTLKDHMGTALLDPIVEETRKYFSKELLQLMRFILIHDSKSYQLRRFDSYKISSNCKEINKNIDFLLSKM